MEDNSVKTVTLKSSDGEQFVVPMEAVMQSRTICHLIEDDCAETAIPLHNVNSRILVMVVEYCTKHIIGMEKAADTPTMVDEAQKAEGSLAEMPKAMSPEEEMKQWDEKFLDIDKDTLLDLILAANYLDIHALLDMTCGKIADMIKGKTPAEIRKTFDIKNDFTPEEEEEILRENAWAFDEEN